MKKYIIPGLLTMMALSLPILAQAQTSPSMGSQQYPSYSPSSTQSQFGTPGSNLNTQQQPSSTTFSSQQQIQTNTPASGVSSQQSPMTPYSNQTSQMNQPNTGVSNQQQTTTQSQTTVGQTTTTTTTTTQVATNGAPPSSGEVIVGTDAASSIAPPLSVGLGTTSINVVNPTPKPVQFTIPALNVSYEVPANAERTIQVDRTQTANLTPGQQVAYYVNDANGNQIASSNLTNYETAISQINTNTQVAAEESRPEPSYHAPSRHRSTVRGYW